MRKRKKKNKQKKIIITLSITFLFIMTTSYAAFTTNINIKGKTTITGKIKITTEKLKELTVAEGDGLYKDTYETDRYIYKGADPNNYITFNNEENSWRIYSIEKDGTIKIIKNKSIGKKAWDTSVSNDWARPAYLNTYLNGTYYNKLTEEAQLLIENHIWPIGPAISNNNDLDGQIESENSIQWTGKIGLLSASEALRANNNFENCSTMKSASNNCELCKTTNYTILEESTWTITAYKNDEKGVYTLTGTKYADYLVGYSANSTRQIFPALYLKSDIELNGSGTQEDPYTIILE